MIPTPVPESYTFAWSASALSVYESCPLRFWAEKVAKVVPYVQGEQAKWGDDVHKALEASAKTGAPLPSNMVQYSDTLHKVQQLAGIVAQAGGLIEYERQFASTRESQPCGWFGDNTYARCASDVFAVIDGWYGIVIDYKTGKPHNPRYGMDMQPVINAKMVMDHFPSIQQVDTSFVYMAHNKTSKATFTRREINIDFQPVGELIYRAEQSVANHNFPANKNGLCRKYCGFTQCPHNGNYTG